MPDAEPPLIGRRRLLGLASGMAAAAALTGCRGGLPGPDRDQTTCVARGQLVRHTRLAGLPLVYEINGRRSAFWFDAGFAAQLEAWLGELGLGVEEVWIYGAWTDGGRDCRSWHDSGRAFDLARLRLPGGEISCRYDEWRSAAGPALEAARTRYWALAASLHRHFSYVVTYLYNAEHHNHIHVDNGRSGGELSVFDPGSITQVQAVQAITSYVWQRPVEITGRFDAPTRRMLTSAGGWQEFLSASAARITR